MANILVIANASDPATLLGYWWMERFAQYASTKGHNVIFQKTPTLQALYKAIVEYDPLLVVANGHGGYKSLRVGDNILIGTKGYDSATKYYIKEGDEPYFKNRLVLLLTCNAGTSLVQALVNNGARAAMGYKKPYIFLSDENLTPEQDEVAKPFFEALLQPAIQLADGATFKEAVKATRKAFKQYIKTTFELEANRYLNYDLDNLIALGDPEAKLN